MFAVLAPRVVSGAARAGRAGRRSSHPAGTSNTTSLTVYSVPVRCFAMTGCQRRQCGQWSSSPGWRGVPILPSVHEPVTGEVRGMKAGNQPGDDLERFVVDDEGREVRRPEPH